MLISPLVDLDELVLRCRDERAKALIGEAVVCYRGGAFRAAIVATWIAVCFDFIEKMRELSLAGDKEAETQLAELEKIHASNDVSRALRFERDLLKLARDKFQLISPLEFTDLERLQDDRNRCAHPSLLTVEEAYSPSGELARLHIATAVNSVLQHPPAQGKFALERLLREVDSEYFPAEAAKAEAFLSTGPLRKPRDSLVRNFIAVLVKNYFSENSFTTRRRVVSALRATGSLHPQVYRAAMQERLSPTFRQIADGQLFSSLLFLDSFPDSWDLLDDDVKHRLDGFIRALPTDYLESVDVPLRIPALRATAELRISRITRKELAEQVFFDLPDKVGDRLIDLYLESVSYDQANNVGKIIVTHAMDLSADQIRTILTHVAANGEVLGSFQLGAVISTLRKHGKIPATEFDTLLQAHNLEEYVEDNDVPF